MKEIKYGGITFWQFENHYDLPQTRLVEINKYVVASEWGYNAATLAENFAGFRRSFDNTKLADAFEYLVNIEHNGKNIEQGFDPFETMHALILVTEEEKATPGASAWVQSGYLEKKVKEIREAGATQKDFAQVNHFFFLKSYPYFNLASLKVFKLLSHYLTSYYELEKITEALEQTMNLSKAKKS